MRIVCPSCTAAYEVPDSLLTAGRAVRCARCGGEWTPVVEVVQEPLPATPLPSAAPPEAPSEPSPQLGLSGMDLLAARAAPSRSALPLRLAWAASLLLLLALGWSAYEWRSQIVQAWPPSARVYAAFGLHLGEDPARDIVH